jgi:hypothetical protein
MRVGHLLLPAMPKQFRYRFVPEAEQRAVAQRKRKVKTDVISECATAILALMLARYPSMDRFIRWYRQQIERIESGELIIPVRLVYEDNQLDRPRKPGPDAVSVEEVRWRTSSVRLELTIWRPYEYSQRRYAEGIQDAAPGTRERERALSARSKWKKRARQVFTRTRTPTSFKISRSTARAGHWPPSPFINGSRSTRTSMLRTLRAK